MKHDDGNMKIAPSAQTPPENATGWGAHIARYVLIGFFTVAPLRVTWLVFDFLLGILADVGTPPLRAAAGLVRPLSETLSGWLLDSAFQKLIAIQLTLGGLCAIGMLASLVPGRKMLRWTEAMLTRLPLVQTDWTMEEAMSFVMTGGANAPDHVRFTRAPATEEKQGA